MENRLVALSVLEDLIHWPLPPRGGGTSTYTGSRPAGGEDDNGGDEYSGNSDYNNNNNILSAGAVEDNNSEPRARKQARYRAVLQLPCLCLKLGRRWVDSEVVPYLLRCAEEEDPQLSFVVGITMLGLALPRRVTEADRERAQKDVEAASSAQVKAGARKEGEDSTTQKAGATGAVKNPLDNVFVTSYFTIDELMPVIEALSASREERTRAFIAQVIIPHLVFGVSIERDGSLEGWDRKYLPAHLFSSAGGEEEGEEGSGDALNTSAGVGYDELESSAAVLAQRNTSGNCKSNPLLTLSTLQETLNFLFDSEYTNLSGPFFASELLARFASGSSGAADSAGNGSGSGSTTRMKRQQQPHCHQDSLLRGAPLELHGISYARDCRPSGGARAGGGMDFFTLNVQARTLVADLSSWMGVFTATRDAQSSSSSSSTAATPSILQQRRQLRKKNVLYATDYIRDSECRDALRNRWRSAQKLFSLLLKSTHPGSVAVAVEAISMLIQTVNWGLSHLDSIVAQEEEQEKEKSREKKVEDKKSVSQRSSAGVVVVGEPHTPLCITAELEAFRYATSRRHVTFALASACAARRMVGSDITPPPSAQQVTAFAKPALVAARDILFGLLCSHHLLVQVPVSSSSSSVESGGKKKPPKSSSAVNKTVLQLGSGPSELRVALLSAWDICFACQQPDGTPDDVAYLMNGRSGLGGFTSGAGSLNSTVNISSDKATATATSTLIAPFLRRGFTNAASSFRLHRTLRLTMLNVLPMLLDLHALYRDDAENDITAKGDTSSSSSSTASPFERSSPSTSPSASSSPAASRVTLAVVCRLLTQILTPPSVLASLMPEGDQCASPRSSSFVSGEESPASLDFELTNVALAAIHRTFAEIAAVSTHLVTLEVKALLSPLATAVTVGSDGFEKALLQATEVATQGAELLTKRLDAVFRQLFNLYQSCVRYVSAYAAWKARWLLARQLPALTSAFLLVLLRTSEAAATLTNHSSSGSNIGAATAATESSELQGKVGSILQNGLFTTTANYYYRVCKLMSDVWASTAAGGGSLFNWVDIEEEEEAEVRSVAAPCAAGIFASIVQASLRLATNRVGSLSASSQGGSFSNPEVSLSLNSSAAMLSTELAPFLQSQLPLLDVITACCSHNLKDSQPRVRCGAAHALSLLSGAVSMLVVTDAPSLPLSTSCTGAVSGDIGIEKVKGVESASLQPLRLTNRDTWRTHLATITSSLLSLMNDTDSTVQMALVAELTDLLVASPHSLSRNSNNSSKSTAGTGFGNGTAAEAQHAALLGALRALATDDIWRCRARYAVLLCDMCYKFLSPPRRRAVPRVLARMRKKQLRAVWNAKSGRYEDDDINEHEDDEEEEDMNAYYVAWSHAQPLYRLARDELLPLLVSVLFDKVKAVRDIALDATVRMSANMATAAAASQRQQQQQQKQQHGRSGGAAGGMASPGSSVTRRSLPSSSGAAHTLTEGDEDVCAGHAAPAGMGIRFVSDVLWPLIHAYPEAWDTYLSRSALLHVAVRLGVDKETILLPLLDQLTYDAVLNVRLVVAKTILEILLANTTPGAIAPAGGQEDGGEEREQHLPAGMTAYNILMNRHFYGGSTSELVSLAGGIGASGCAMMRGDIRDEGGAGGSGGGEGDDAAAAIAQTRVFFTKEEKNGVVLQLLRRLLEDSSADVRDEAAKALKVCF